MGTDEGRDVVRAVLEYVFWTDALAGLEVQRLSQEVPTWHSGGEVRIRRQVLDGARRAPGLDEDGVMG